MNDFEQLMTAHDPARDLAPLDEDTALLIVDRATRDPRRRNRWRRWGSVAAALALVGGVGAWQLLTPGAAEARADEALRLAAVKAVDPTTTAGQWWRITVTNATPEDSCPDKPEGDCAERLLEWTGIDYVAPTGARAPVRLRELNQRWSAPEGSSTAGGEPGKSGRPEPFGFIDRDNDAQREGSAAWVAAIPTDAEALRTWLYAGTEDDEVAWSNAVNALQTGALPAKTRSTLFDAMATIPGIEVAETTLSVGSGVVVGRRSGKHVRDRIVLDPDEGKVLGTVSEFRGEEFYSARTTWDVVDEIPADHRTLASHCEARSATLTCDGGNP